MQSPGLPGYTVVSRVCPPPPTEAQQASLRAHLPKEGRGRAEIQAMAAWLGGCHTRRSTAISGLQDP